jgi:hypothetical protein
MIQNYKERIYKLEHAILLFSHRRLKLIEQLGVVVMLCICICEMPGSNIDWPASCLTEISHSFPRQCTVKPG